MKKVNFNKEVEIGEGLGSMAEALKDVKIEKIVEKVIDLPEETKKVSKPRKPKEIIPFEGLTEEQLYMALKEFKECIMAEINSSLDTKLSFIQYRMYKSCDAMNKIIVRDLKEYILDVVKKG
ncbi:MAG TPA: hypothetical protein VIK72_00325 [Clostridiaceae bacterium]